MAATTAGALKQIIEALGLGLAAYRRVAPSNAVLPYVVITDGITGEKVPGGDGGRGDGSIENVQVDLWQRFKATNGTVVESQALIDAVVDGLHGRKPASAGANTTKPIDAIRVPFMSTTEYADDNTVRTRMSVDVRRA